MAKKKEKSTQSNISAVFLVAMISVLLILVGGMMSFVPDMKTVYFAYIAGGVFMVTGFIAIIKYFVKEEYRLVSNYDFSAGVLLALLGLVGLLRADEIGTALSVYIGLLMLVNAVIFLQYTVQLGSVRAGGVWVGVTLIVTVLIALVSLETLLEVLSVFSKNPTTFYYLLIVVGVVGLLWILIVASRTRKFIKNEDEMARRNLEEDVTDGGEPYSDSDSDAGSADDGDYDSYDPDLIDELDEDR